MSRTGSIGCVVLLAAVVLTGVRGTNPATAGQARDAQVDLTGEWRANDGGTYWIRQVGPTIFWTGFSGSPNTPTMGLSFANVFYGTVVDTMVSGKWADVPRGTTRSSGKLVLQIREGTRPTLVRRAATGGFGASVWRRTS